MHKLVNQKMKEPIAVEYIVIYRDKRIETKKQGKFKRTERKFMQIQKIIYAKLKE